jgi:putative addiction module antidote
MNKQVRLINVGNSTGVVISREMLAESGFAPGEEVVMKASPGRIEIEAADDDFERQMVIAREVMKRRRKALRQLAK